jgi:NAD+ kinase
MKRIGVIANCDKPQVAEVLARLASHARLRGLTLLSTGPTARKLRGARNVTPTRLAAQAEAVLVLGGDGTLLSAVRLLGARPVPLLGVNLGNLGFLTSVPQENLERALDALAAGTVTITRRTLLAGRLLRGRRRVAEVLALNDIVLSWGRSSRINTLAVSVNREPVTSYRCDGLIVSTPTGSTGHSLSAGGPIVLPGTPAILLNVICPHTLSARPLVIPDTSRLAIEVQDTTEGLLLSVDGQEDTTVQQGDRLEIRKAAPSVRLIHLPGHSHFALLRQKLNWRGSSVE